MNFTKEVLRKQLYDLIIGKLDVIEYWLGATYRPDLFGTTYRPDLYIINTRNTNSQDIILLRYNYFNKVKEFIIDENPFLYKKGCFDYEESNLPDSFKTKLNFDFPILRRYYISDNDKKVVETILDDIFIDESRDRKLKELLG